MALDAKGLMEGIRGLKPEDFKNLSAGIGEDFEPIVSAIVPQLSVPARRALALKTVGDLDTDEKQDVIQQAVRDLPKDERESVLQGVMPPPDDQTRNSLWRIVVWAFSTILVGSFLTLAVGVFVSPTGAVRPELILSMFTSVVGFLAGLFVPTPGGRGQSRNGGSPAGTK